MNNEEAKFRLMAYRPGGQDSGDASMRKALEQAKRDPSLALWLLKEHAFDTAVSDKLSRIHPPAGLRESILAGAKLSPRRSWWQKPVWLSIAACVALCMVLASQAWFGTRQQTAASLAHFVFEDLRHGIHQGLGGPDAPLQAALADGSKSLESALPEDLGALQAANCRRISWGGKEWFEICFMRDGLVYHLYVSGRDQGLDSYKARFFSEKELNAAIWGISGKVYVLAGTVGREALENLLRTK